MRPITLIKSLQTGFGRREGLERGSAATEMALIAPVLGMLMMGVLDFGRVFNAYLSVASAAHEGALYAARGTLLPSTSSIAQVVYAESGTLLNATNTTIAVSVPSGATTTEVVRVRVTYTFKPLTAMPVSASFPVSATASAPLPRPPLTTP